MALGAEGRTSQALLDTLARSLRRSIRPPRAWRDEHGRAGVVAGVAGALAEDLGDAQPLIDTDVVFACQVRLDNRRELLGDLSVPRQEWPDMADSEVLYRCYRKWGRGCVLKVLGDYVFAAWHRDSGRVVAAVDHFASSPLFYAECGSELILSPQLAVVLAHPAVPRDLNLLALAALLAPKSLPGATAYRAIHTMPGGHWLIRDGHALRIEPWWHPDPTARTRYRDPRDYAVAASALFEQAVEARLRTSGPVAATMSGGLDSTLVSVTAARLLADRGAGLTAYTSVPEPGLPRAERRDWDSCDFAYAAAVARMYPNVSHVPVPPGGLCPLDLMPAIHAHSRTPVRNGANHLWLGRISRLAAESGARVVLTGQRGNSTISASGAGGIRELVRDLRWLTAMRRLTELRRNERPSIAGLAAAVLRGSRKRSTQSPSATRRPGIKFLSTGFRRRIEALCTSDHDRQSPDEFRIALMTSTKQPWTADPWVQWGVQWRDPTADRRLVECLLSFPVDAFLIGGRHRGLARTMGEGLLPDLVRLRGTQGAQAPEHPGMLALHNLRYMEAVNAIARSALFRSLCDVGRLRHALRELASGSLDLTTAQSVDRAIDAGLFIAAHEARK